MGKKTAVDRRHIPCFNVGQKIDIEGMAGKCFEYGLQGIMDLQGRRLEPSGM
jgi:hypothetical protein